MFILDFSQLHELGSMGTDKEMKPSGRWLTCSMLHRKCVIQLGYKLMFSDSKSRIPGGFKDMINSHKHF